MSRFLVVVTSYDWAPWLDKCLRSIEAQRYDDYGVCVVDDASPSDEHRRVARSYCERNGWRLLVNEERRGALFSRHAALMAAQPADDEIVCLVGGDDWLAHRHVLSSLREAYEREDIWITSGASRALSTAPSRAERAAEWNRLLRERRAEFARHRDAIVGGSLYRRIPWCWSSPLTFRALLWRHIDPRDFRRPDGTWFTVSGDHAYVFPLLELAAGRLAMLDEVHYVYNLHEGNGDADPRVEREQRAMSSLIRGRPPYPPLSTAP